ncbi:DUF493 family protein YbeD [Neiella marina]|uniref:UPF0250 protein K0504_06740 n=1 Tax=Neiella holothuriorum TaxID=2870530 RepID=A0ABS7EEP1_9GAMM|nr:DUF493 family protein YbeD [Neiella holothuriorum]MBW8190725.1 DUF493 family protein YbeD [Neiella holothuriorum]
MMDTKFGELLDFPCNFPFKVLGVADESLPEKIIAVIQQHAPGDYAPKVKPSSKGNYHSVTIDVTVTSKEHVETLYVALGDIDLVRYVL